MWSFIPLSTHQKSVAYQLMKLSILPVNMPKLLGKLLSATHLGSPNTPAGLITFNQTQSRHAWGNFGKLNAGVNPLRGQNNVQGASDSGAFRLTSRFSKKFNAPGGLEKFEAAWGSELPKRRGITKITAMNQMLRGPGERRVHNG
ncbi:MAG: hypothetical protein Ct9H300mP19_11230 [Dehalococcoidia bacterium]|nr:MAG: hypothetical protein Ct9H300mP19_11230 [Dehalococcoidia bacterium]